MDTNTIQNLAKQSEGTMLALNAIAEQLQKSNDLNERVVAKLDDDDEKTKVAEEEDVEKAEYENFLKTISDVVSKQMNERFSGIEKQIRDLGGDKSKKVSGKASWPMSSRSGSGDDEEMKQDVLTNPTENGAQKTIEAMEKQDMGFEEDEDEDEMGMNGSEEYPMEEDEGMEEEMEEEMEGDGEYSETEVRNMARMIKELRKDMATMKKGESTRVEKEVEMRLRKAGWREEKGLAKGRLTTLGGNDVPIVKSDTSGIELVDQLESLPWSELALLKEAKAQGFTDGIPQEIIDLA